MARKAPPTKNNSKTKKVKPCHQWSVRRQRMEDKAIAAYKAQRHGASLEKLAVLEKYKTWQARNRDPRRELAAAINRAVDVVERLAGGVRA